MGCAVRSPRAACLRTYPDLPRWDALRERVTVVAVDGDLQKGRLGRLLDCSGLVEGIGNFGRSVDVAWVCIDPVDYVR